MKQYYNNCFFLLIIGFIALTACNKASDGTPREGKLTGSVLTWNDKTTLIPDKGGITVSIDYPISTSTVTDSNGVYTFNNLEFDKYDLSFSKAGYGTYKIFSYAHSYNPTMTETVNTIPVINFAKTATTTVTGLIVTKTTYNSLPGVTYQVTVSPTPTTLNRAYLRYFLSTSPTLTSTNYVVYTPSIGTSTAVTIDGFANDELTGFGFSKGQTIYIKAYGDSQRANDYDDPNLRYRVFPNLNLITPASISFVMQ